MLLQEQAHGERGGRHETRWPMGGGPISIRKEELKRVGAVGSHRKLRSKSCFSEKKRVEKRKKKERNFFFCPCEAIFESKAIILFISLASSPNTFNTAVGESLQQTLSTGQKEKKNCRFMGIPITFHGCVPSRRAPPLLLSAPPPPSKLFPFLPRFLFLPTIFFRRLILWPDFSLNSYHQTLLTNCIT